MSGQWYCRYCSHYTGNNRCTCDDLATIKKTRKPRLKDKSWMTGKLKAYVGHQVPRTEPSELENLIYIGGRHYESTAQIHLSVEEAKYVRDKLDLAIARAERFEKNWTTGPRK